MGISMEEAWSQIFNNFKFSYKALGIFLKFLKSIPNFINPCQIKPKFLQPNHKIDEPSIYFCQASKQASCKFLSSIHKFAELTVIEAASMDPRSFIQLTYKGDSKLVCVGADSLFSDVGSQILGTWPELKFDQFCCKFNVGSIRNCSLATDDDLRNLVFLCQHQSESVVVVDITERYPLSGNGQVNLNDVSSLGSITSDVNQNMLITSDVSRKRTLCLTQGEFIGDASIPNYVMCPTEIQKSYLSDKWGDIMKDGVGKEFIGGAVEFRTELIKYTTKLGFKFKYMRNEKRYIHVVCFESHCDWFIKAKRNIVNSHFVVDKVNLNHQCVGNLVMQQTSRLVPNIIGDLIFHNVKSNPTSSGKDMVRVMKESYAIDISYWKAWRSVESARNKVFGSYAESYDHLRWYCSAIERTNPGSFVHLEKNSVTHHFERLFIAFKACVEGFKSCRPMLFLDGTFMKGRAKGTMLSATAKDGDNGLFPVAFAIVSAENTNNWAWFLCKLRDCIQYVDKVFYISDRNCGLMSAFPQVFDEPVHFYCLYHLLSNLKGRFGGGWNSAQRTRLVDQFKECAYAPNRRIFDEKIERFKEDGGKVAEEWLEDLPYEKWVVAHSSHITRYGEMTSNAAESFNSWITDARSLPITYMIESIRRGICRWYVEQREESNKWSGALCKSKEKVWYQLTDIGKSWLVSKAPNGQFEVYSDISVCVDLGLKVCTCYQWQIRGFPCSHVVAVIRKHCSTVYSHVDKCFFTATYRECYKNDINPIPETEKYECESIGDQVKILPPRLNRQAGRPKKQRIASYGEFYKKKPTVCKRCFKSGSHDSLTCFLAPGHSNGSMDQDVD